VPVAPHVMFYGPCMTNADLGSDGETGPALVLTPGTPHALIIVFVEKHSTGHASGDKPSGGSQ